MMHFVDDAPTTTAAPTTTSTTTVCGGTTTVSAASPAENATVAANGTNGTVAQEGSDTANTSAAATVNATAETNSSVANVSLTATPVSSKRSDSLRLSRRKGKGSVEEGFKWLDSNADRGLSADELSRHLAPYDFTAKDAHEMHRAMDADKDGAVSRKEFTAALGSSSGNASAHPVNPLRKATLRIKHHL